MNTRTIRSLLWLAMAAFCAAAVLVLAVSIGRQPQPSQAVTPPVTRDARGIDPQVSALPTLAEFEGVWGLDLQRPLYDQPVAAAPAAGAAPTAKRAARLPYRLLGTAIEPGHNLAMLSADNGRIEFKAVGDRVGDAEVIQITRGTVTLTYRGKQVQLSAAKKGSTP